MVNKNKLWISTLLVVKGGWGIFLRAICLERVVVMGGSPGYSNYCPKITKGDFKQKNKEMN